MLTVLTTACSAPSSAAPLRAPHHPAATPPAASADEPLDGLRMLGLLDALASDELGGRYTLHDDIRRAAETITSRYREAGVAPACGDDYLLEFEVVLGAEPGPELSLSLESTTATPGQAPGRVAIDRAALTARPEGAAGQAEGPLVLVGYGLAIDDPERPFDELAGLPLQGAVAVLWTGTPPRSAPDDAPLDRPRPAFRRRDGDLSAKLRRLAEAGAAAVIVIDDPAPGRPFPPPGRPVRDRVELPVVQLDPARAYARLPQLERLRAEIDRAGEPRSRELPGQRARLNADMTLRTARAPNILAMVPGTDLADEIVLVGAHYDHIGTDAPGRGHCRAAAATDEGEPDRVCNGADDNASGSAIVAELAMTLSASPHRPRRTLVFVHFAGEELGLLGSRELAARLGTQPPFAGRRVVAMLNIDMVGRLRERLTVSGVGSSGSWMEILDAIGPRDMRVLYDRALTLRSDHAPFYEQGIPALFFFTELHDDYHAPGDEAPRIVRDGVLSVAALVADVTRVVGDGHAIAFSAPQRPGDGLVSALPGEHPESVVKEVGPATVAVP